jgi:dTDP-4-amino-4,6-dideoxygalactose transaminase
MLEEIWERGIVTNNGPFHELFQAELARFLGIDHLALTANGMLALEAAIDAVQLQGEVVTTPYSFVATSHAIKRGRLIPVFVDVRENDLNIDPLKVEEAITDRTSAIVAVHCYGNPCDVDALESIASRHNLTLIYDAAHAFGVRHRGRSLASWGDFSTLSFHGTKVFNTFEGGAVIARREDDLKLVNLGRNFGITSEVSIPSVGTNAKMSEFNAALGLLQLRHFQQVVQSRKEVDQRYRDALSSVPGIRPLPLAEETEPNHSYFPILVTEEYPLTRDELYEWLKSNNVFSRRYFYPLLSNLPTYRDLPSAAATNLPVANRAAEQILCLPIYSELSEADQERVIGLVRAVPV